MVRWKLPVTLAVVGFTAFGCSGSDDDLFTEVCEGRQLVPHLSPVSFGELRPLGSATEDLHDASRTPYSWPLILHAPCDQEVTIDRACIVGDTDHFTLEGPSDDVASRGNDSAVRITYNRQTPNSGDEQDNIAIIIESNAEDSPLVVPLCARVVDGSPDNSEPLDCVPPAETSC
jgi:hypothetical protein